MKWSILLIISCLTKWCNAQSVAINNSGVAAHSSAITDISSTTKGMLIPRMTLAQRNAIPGPATGLLVFVTDVAPQRFYYYNGTFWVDLVSATSNTWQVSGTDIYNTNSGRVIIDHNIALYQPVAKFQVNEGNVFFTKGGSAVSAPAMFTSYSGRRMAWYADQAAFRMGYYDFNIWNSSFIGTHSFAGGYNCTASGDRSFSYGSINSSTGNRSVTMGGGDTATGDYAAAFNISNHAVADFSSCFGSNNYSKYEGGLVLGTYNDTTSLSNPADWVTKNRLFQIGNGLSFSNRSNAMTVLQNGNIGIGSTAPTVPLQFANAGGNKIAFFQNGSNYYGIGTQASLLQLYTPTATDDIAFGYGNSGAFTENVRMDGSGSLAVRTNLTVQNGRGIIRNTDGTQSKKLSTTATVNATFTAGQTQTFALTWPEAFAATPEAYVANATGAGGWAEVVMSIANVTTTGATLYVYNPRTVSASPNFIVRVIAIGAQ